MSKPSDYCELCQGPHIEICCPCKKPAIKCHLHPRCLSFQNNPETSKENMRELEAVIRETSRRIKRTKSSKRFRYT